MPLWADPDAVLRPPRVRFITAMPLGNVPGTDPDRGSEEWGGLGAYGQPTRAYSPAVPSVATGSSTPGGISSTRGKLYPMMVCPVESR